jgi:hypothetical protein
LEIKIKIKIKMTSIIERLYSDAFEDGINYAVEKMFARKFINPKNIPNQSITRKGKWKGDIFNGDAFHEKVKSMQPRTHTVDEIDAMKSRIKGMLKNAKKVDLGANSVFNWN